MVSGSRLAIERVLTNLVGNAAKYSPAGTHHPGPRRAASGAAHLIVDDEGPGVPEEEREQIFSRFFRGKGDEVIRTRGAGLGLVDRHRVRRLHGRPGLHRQRPHRWRPLRGHLPA